MVILDTNIIIDHLRLKTSQKSKLTLFVEKFPYEVLGISTISIQELYEGKSTRTEEKEKDLLAIISPLKIIPYSYEIAKLAGEIARDVRQPIEFADSAIGATAIFHQADLYTLNNKHFQLIPHLVLYQE